MTEQELRALVREAISRHVSGTTTQPRSAGAASMHARPVHTLTMHASHGLLMVPDGSEADGPCIIEPAVMCNHCGYCKSYGH